MNAEALQVMANQRRNQVVVKWAVLPILYPVLKLLFSRKGIAFLGIVVAELITAYTGNIEIAQAWQAAVVLTITYIVSTAWEDVAKQNAAKGRL